MLRHLTIIVCLVTEDVVSGQLTLTDLRNTYGIEIASQSDLEAAGFFKKFLERERLKHQLTKHKFSDKEQGAERNDGDQYVVCIHHPAAIAANERG